MSEARSSTEDVTELLQAWGGGDQDAFDRLLPLVEAELHRLAHGYLGRERLGHTLQTTALVNEAYLKLVRQRVEWQNRAHFFAIAATVMRRILVDHARRVAFAKRGGGIRPLPLDEACVLDDRRADALMALDDALRSLARIDLRKSRVVEMRYFGGLSVEETAEVLGVHPDTVTRDWRGARAFLRREIESG